MPRWIDFSKRFLAAHQIHSVVHADCRVGPTDDLAPEDALAAFRECRPEDQLELVALLRDPVHRAFVKLLSFATRDVPEPLFAEFVRAGVMTEDPSANQLFLFPAAIVHGRRRVFSELLLIFEAGSDREKSGVANAVYWCSMPPSHMRWPYESRRNALEPDPGEPIDDLVQLFEDRALVEFLANPAVEVRRGLVHYVPRASERSPNRGAEAIAIARTHSDDYIRSRILVDLGESKLFPCKPDSTGGAG